MCIVNSRITITVTILTLVVGLVVADTALLEPLPPRSSLNLSQVWQQVLRLNVSQSSTTKSPPSAPRGAVEKRSEFTIEEQLPALGIEAKESNESTMLEQITQENDSLIQRTLLERGDRIGSIAWINTPLVKEYFIVLKESLSQSFSPALDNLVDTTRRLPGKPVVDELSFYDPGIAQEKLVFLRIRSRLYELHVAPGRMEEMQGVIEELMN